MPRALMVFGYPLGLGGHFRSALALVPGLIAGGFEVTVFAPGGEAEMAQRFRTAGAACVFQECGGWFGGFRRFRERLRLTRESELVHAQDALALREAYLLAGLCRRPLVFTQAGGHWRVRGRIDEAEVVIFSEELSAEVEASEGAPMERVHLIRERIDAETFTPGGREGALRGRYGLSPGTTVVFMATRLDEHKKAWLEGLPALGTLAARRGMDMVLLVAGDGPLRERLARELAASGCPEGRVVYLGPIQDVGELIRHYRMADFVVGSGRGILEAMACGKAVAVLGAGGGCVIVSPETVGEIARHNFSGRHLEDNGDRPAQLFEALERLVADPGLSERLQRFSREYILDSMDARLGGGKLVGVYRRALARRSSLAGFLRWRGRYWRSLVRGGLRRTPRGRG